MVLIAKAVVLLGTLITLAGASIGTGVLFSGFLSGAARNPEETENLFNSALVAFALIETFVFMSFLVSGVVYFTN